MSCQACTGGGCTLSPPSQVHTEESTPENVPAPLVTPLSPNTLNISWTPPDTPNGEKTNILHVVQACARSHTHICTTSREKQTHHLHRRKPEDTFTHTYSICFYQRWHLQWCKVQLSRGDDIRGFPMYCERTEEKESKVMGKWGSERKEDRVRGQCFTEPLEVDEKCSLLTEGRTAGWEYMGLQRLPTSLCILCYCIPLMFIFYSCSQLKSTAQSWSKVYIIYFWYEFGIQLFMWIQIPHHK